MARVRGVMAARMAGQIELSTRILCAMARCHRRRGRGPTLTAAQHAGVVAVEGLEEEDFVAGIDEREKCGLEGSGGAGGNEDFAVGVYRERVGAGKLCGKGVTKACDAVETGVDVVAVADGALGCFGDDSGWVGVADSLGKVDAADGVAGDAHGANFGLEGARDELAEVQRLGG